MNAKMRQRPQRNPEVQMRVFFVALAIKFKLVISAEKAKYISTENQFKIPQSGVKKNSSGRS